MRKWHYQIVHHGLWDYDPASAPNLVTITVDGTLSVTEAHAHADAVERAVQGDLGAADVTVHVEPTQGLSAR